MQVKYVQDDDDDDDDDDDVLTKINRNICSFSSHRKR